MRRTKQARLSSLIVYRIQDTQIGEYEIGLTGNEQVALPQKVWLLYNPYQAGSPFFIADEARRTDWTENEVPLSFYSFARTV